MTAAESPLNLESLEKLHHAMHQVELESAHRPHEVWMSPRTRERVELSAKQFATYPTDTTGPLTMFGAQVKTSSRLADDVIIAVALSGKLNFAGITGIRFVDIPKPPEPPTPPRTIADDMADLNTALAAVFTAIVDALHLPQLVDWLSRILTRRRG